MRERLIGARTPAGPPAALLAEAHRASLEGLDVRGLGIDSLQLARQAMRRTTTLGIDGRAQLTQRVASLLAAEIGRPRPVGMPAEAFVSAVVPLPRRRCPRPARRAWRSLVRRRPARSRARPVIPPHRSHHRRLQGGTRSSRRPDPRALPGAAGVACGDGRGHDRLSRPRRQHPDARRRRRRRSSRPRSGATRTPPAPTASPGRRGRCWRRPATRWPPPSAARPARSCSRAAAPRPTTWPSVACSGPRVVWRCAVPSSTTPSCDPSRPSADGWWR